jgi:hypothetical protein
VRLTGAGEGRGGAGSIELGKGGRGWPRLVWEKRSSGGPFYRRPGRGRARSGVHRRARHGGDGGAQWRRRDGSGRGVTGLLGWRKGTEAQGTNRAGERVMAR